MKIACASAAGDALSLRIARVLSQAGHEVTWLAGALAAPEEHAADGLRIVHIARSDLHPGHWQKSWHPPTTRAVRKLLRERAIEVLHVLHWRQLSRDLVHAAARERIPAVVSLQDATTSCLLGTRVPPEGGACEVQAAAHPCLGCAGSVEPRTPWVPPDAQFLAQYVHHQDLARELALARVVLVHAPDAREHARRFLAGKLAQAPSELMCEPLSDSGLAARLLEVYSAAVRAGAPDPGPPENPYAVLLAEASAREWDAAAQRALR